MNAVTTGQPRDRLPASAPDPGPPITSAPGDSGPVRALAVRADDPALCPLPGCSEPRGPGKTGACSKSHANRLAAAARAGRPPTPEPPAPEPGAECPLPGCSEPRGPGKTGACCLAHASKLAWSARNGSAPQPDPPAVRTPPHATKKAKAEEELRVNQRHQALAERLRQLDAASYAAFRAHR